jgi:hypothetical protein
MAEDMQDNPQAVTPETIASNGSKGEALHQRVQGDPSTWQRIKAYFEREHKGRYLLDEETHTIQWIVTQDNGTYRVVVRWEEKPRRLTVRIPHLIAMPQQKHIATALLMNLINGELFMGNFELDPTDGELYFRNNMAVADGSVTEEQLETYCFASLSTVDTFLPAFLRLRFGDATPQEAFEEVVEELA